jgi:MFS family permease
VGLVNVLGTVVAGSFMDKAGRKQLLTLSFALMGASMLTMSLGLAWPAFASLAGPIALVGTLTYILGFALGAGPVPGLLVPEITPAKLRGTVPSLYHGLLSKGGEGVGWNGGQKRVVRLDWGL